MNSKTYRIFEGLRVAFSLTFLSGYLNAFTFITQGARFSGIQSGNLVYLVYFMMKRDVAKAINFLIPLLVFILGQFCTYLLRVYFEKRKWPWHFGISLLMLVIISLTTILSSLFSSNVIIALLTFVASLQIETFRRLRGAAYANVMMTGNIKNASYIWFKGVMEKDKQLMKIGRNTFLIIVGFMLGVASATYLSFYLNEYSLVGAIVPSSYVTYCLWKEKRG